MPSPITYQKVTSIDVTRLTAQRDSHKSEAKSLNGTMSAGSGWRVAAFRRRKKEEAEF